MTDNIKSGKEVIDEFFSEILNIKNTHEKTVKELISLYSLGKLTEINLQNTLDQIIQNELDQTEKQW